MDERKSEDDAEGATTAMDEDKTSETEIDKGSEAVKEDEDKSGEAAKMDKAKGSEATTDGNNSSEAGKTDGDTGRETEKIDQDKCVDGLKTDEDKTVVAGSGDKADASVPVTTCPTDTTGSSQAQPDSPAAKAKSGKVDILLKSTGGAPIMKKTRWTVDGNKPMSWIVNFLRRYLKCEQQQAIFVYVNQSFAPSLDVAVGVLFECFGADGKLVLHYCMTQAWG